MLWCAMHMPCNSMFNNTRMLLSFIFLYKYKTFPVFFLLEVDDHAREKKRLPGMIDHMNTCNQFLFVLFGFLIKANKQALVRCIFLFDANALMIVIGDIQGFSKLCDGFDCGLCEFNKLH